MALRILSGAFKGRILKSPPEKTTRPTQGVLRSAVFNICQADIEGARFLDLFAGSGAMGLEALSRGAKSATFVEKDKKAAVCIRKNISLLNVSEQTEVFSIDALTAIHKMTKPFDIIYIDPPYDTNLLEIVETLLSRQLAMSWLFLEEREKSHCPIEHPSLTLYDRRRYGVALLSIFTFK
ncbi:MAG: 16S rRNA (guanine(966)-N(2))-methyltransferase RsmD [Chlamydiae bacterium]|nr:16S rRNA (guanine(966)-N(2))-methyltransferase RsmD [Chlamydiota bacterium]